MHPQLSQVLATLSFAMSTLAVDLSFYPSSSDCDRSATTTSLECRGMDAPAKCGPVSMPPGSTMLCNDCDDVELEIIVYKGNSWEYLETKDVPVQANYTCLNLGGEGKGNTYTVGVSMTSGGDGASGECVPLFKPNVLVQNDDNNGGTKEIDLPGGGLVKGSC